MSNWYKFIFIVLIVGMVVLPLSGCRKTELVVEFKEYEGLWLGENTTMQLNSNGRAFYAYSDGAVTKHINDGRIIINRKKKTLTIKFLSFKVSFHIDTEPTTINIYGYPTTYMVLDGKVFERID